MCTGRHECSGNFIIPISLDLIESFDVITLFSMSCQSAMIKSPVQPPPNLARIRWMFQEVLCSTLMNTTFVFR